MAKARKSKITKNLRDLRDPLDYPETRIERYLKCIKTGDNTDLPSTVNTRIERYLYCIATGDNSTLPDHPETMIELYLDAIATGNVQDLPHDPQDRLQRYLYAAAYVDSSLLPSADYTRIEKYISSILGGTTFITDQAPYLFRVSGGDENANVKYKELDTLVGATMAWNQLVDVGTTEVMIPSGHKYYAIISGTTSIGASAGSAISVTGGTDILTDITLMLGPTIADYVYTLESGTAGAGVAWLKSHGFFTKLYYAHDAGSPQSVCVSAHRMTGFNQWNEEWEEGAYAKDTGNKASWNGAIRSKNKYICFPSTRYNAAFQSSTTLYIFFYDAGENFISYISKYRSVANKTFSTPSNARYFTICTNNDVNSTYHNDICINISQPDTSISPHNGEYLPFTLHTYALDHSVTRRGIYKLDADNKLYADGDTDDGKGTMTISFVEQTFNGSEIEEWIRTSGSASNPPYYFFILGPEGYVVDDTAVSSRLVQNQNISYTNDEQGFRVVNNTVTHNAILVIRDTSSPDDTLENFRSRLATNPVTVVFKIATPTTAAVETFVNPQQVDRNGTEEYVDFPYFVEDRDVEVPVGHITQYPQ